MAQKKLRPWTENELEILRKNASTLTFTEVSALLDRPRDGVILKAHREGIRYARKGDRRRRSAPRPQPHQNLVVNVASHSRERKPQRIGGLTEAEFVAKHIAGFLRHVEELRGG